MIIFCYFSQDNVNEYPNIPVFFPLMTNTWGVWLGELCVDNPEWPLPIPFFVRPQ